MLAISICILCACLYHCASYNITQCCYHITFYRKVINYHIGIAPSNYAVYDMTARPSIGRLPMLYHALCTTHSSYVHDSLGYRTNMLGSGITKDKVYICVLHNDSVITSSNITGYHAHIYLDYRPCFKAIRRLTTRPQGRAMRCAVYCVENRTCCKRERTLSPNYVWSSPCHQRLWNYSVLDIST